MMLGPLKAVALPGSNVRADLEAHTTQAFSREEA